MSALRQRAPRKEDPKHLAFVRTQTCCLPHCRRQAEPAHLRMACLALGKEYTGKGEKPDDKWTVPLCPYHHRIGADCQHNSNEEQWWALRGINPFAIAAALWKASGGEERAKIRRPVKQPRKIKDRKPREMRRKVPEGRPLQSRNSFKPAHAYRGQFGPDNASGTDHGEAKAEIEKARSKRSLAGAYYCSRRDRQGNHSKASLNNSCSRYAALAAAKTGGTA